MTQHRVVHNRKLDLHEANDVVTLEVPFGSRIISVANVANRVVVYFVRHATDYENVQERKILFARTGHMFQLPANHRFLGTMVFNEGEYVLHAFDVTQD